MGYVWNSLNEFPFTHNYDDDLREVISMMIKLGSTYDDILKDFEELKKEFEKLPEQVEEVQKEFEQLQKEFDALVSKMNSLEGDFSKLQAEYEVLKQMVLNLQIMYDNFSTLIDIKIKANNITLYKRMAEIQVKLQNEIDALWKEIEKIGRFDLFNRLEGFEQPIGEVVQDYYEGLRVHAITNAEFSELGLTNNEFAAFRLTNRMFNTQGRDWLNHFFQFKGINPATGHKTRESNVNSYLLTLFLGTRPNSYWDLTNDEYAALNLTNEQRLYYDRSYDLPTGVVMHSENGTGLTNSESSKLILTD